GARPPVRRPAALPGTRANPPLRAARRRPPFNRRLSAAVCAFMVRQGPPGYLLVTYERAATRPEGKTVVQTFDAWLNVEMSNRGIRSARRLAMEAGLDPDRVADWVLGTAVPNEAECDKLAAYLKVPAAEVRERRFPGRHRPSL